VIPETPRRRPTGRPPKGRRHRRACGQAERRRGPNQPREGALKVILTTPASQRAARASGPVPSGPFASGPARRPSCTLWLQRGAVGGPIPAAPAWACGCRDVARRPADPVLCGLYKARAIGCKARVSRDITVFRRGTRGNQDLWRERGPRDPRADGAYRQVEPRPGARIPAALGAFGILYRRMAARHWAAWRGAAAPVRPQRGRPARA
jgi:hypothetical protein